MSSGAQAESKCPIELPTETASWSRCVAALSQGKERKSMKNGIARRMVEASRAEVMKNGRAGRIGGKIITGRKAGIKTGRGGINMWRSR